MGYITWLLPSNNLLVTCLNTEKAATVRHGFCPPPRVGQQKGGTSPGYGSALSAAAVCGEGWDMDVLQEGREGTCYSLIAPPAPCQQHR